MGMMLIKEKEYKDFSWDFRRKANHKPLVAHFELTYRCILHCRHCYSECYNNNRASRRELSTKKQKQLLDKCKAGNVLWLCFTGGDPLFRKDFAEIYAYAKNRGFVITVFSSLAGLDRELFRMFCEHPPFKIETTLNSSDAGLYHKITKTNLFERHIDAIKKLINAGIYVRVKTLITKQNLHQIERIKELVESLGAVFTPSAMVYAQLNGNKDNTALRLHPQDMLMITKKYGHLSKLRAQAGKRKTTLKDLTGRIRGKKVLSCAAGIDTFWITARGRMIVCCDIRKPDYDLLKSGNSVEEGFYSLNRILRSWRFKTDSLCGKCKYRRICSWCPGRAFIETGNSEEPVGYFCELTKRLVKDQEENKSRI